jgi:hypothetical protein
VADSVITQTISTTDAAVTVGCQDNPLVSIEVSGIWAGTLNIETNLDPDNPIWRAAKVFTEANVGASASITGNGRWIIQAAGVGQVRARLNPATSGAAVVTLRAGDNETFGLSGGGGGGGGAVTVADGADVAQGTTTDAGIITDISGTAIGFLRGLVKQSVTFLSRFPAALTGSGNLKTAVAESLPAGTNVIGGVNINTSLSEATDSVSGHVGGYNKVVNLLLTRPANVTAYSAGDEIADTAGTAAQRSFVGAGRVNGGSGVIDGATLIFSDNPAVTPTLKLYLFDTDPTSAGDNAAFAPTDAQLATCLGVLTFSGGEVGTTGTTGNILFDSGPAAIDFTCAGGSTTLYFLLVTRTAFTSGATSSTITLRLRVSQN